MTDPGGMAVCHKCFLDLPGCLCLERAPDGSWDPAAPKEIDALARVIHMAYHQAIDRTAPLPFNIKILPFDQLPERNRLTVMIASRTVYYHVKKAYNSPQSGSSESEISP